MLRKRTLVFVVLAMLVMAVPAVAKMKEPVGERIEINPYSDVTEIEFPAGQPFHVKHGHRLDPGADSPIGRFGYELEIDGVLQEADFVIRSVDHSWDPWFLERSWVFNYPDGMEGSHAFTGHSIMPCQWAVDHNYYFGSCSSSNARVRTMTKSLTVHFVQ
jgi:hypothetical protein